jgi:hypothetical protein
MLPSMVELASPEIGRLSFLFDFAYRNDWLRVGYCSTGMPCSLMHALKKTMYSVCPDCLQHRLIFWTAGTR